MLIVRLLKDVRSDIPTRQHLCVRKGELAEAVRNPHGAVSAKLRGGGLLGLKPDEFEVVADDCPLVHIPCGACGHEIREDGTCGCDDNRHPVSIFQQTTLGRYADRINRYEEALRRIETHPHSGTWNGLVATIESMRSIARTAVDEDDTPSTSRI